MKPEFSEVEYYNLGTEEQPQYVKLSKTLCSAEKAKYAKLFKELKDVFAWKYSDLKTYDTSIFQHQIPLQKDIKSFRQKLRQRNPLLRPMVQQEIKNICDAKIIIPVRYSAWVANMVPVRKKSGETRNEVAFPTPEGKELNAPFI